MLLNSPISRYSYCILSLLVVLQVRNAVEIRTYRYGTFHNEVSILFSS